ncbi:MAG: hypothetical protein LQ338_004070 [Usnochroma carphineum]|nr:MAG: hypothetical protein LQ338_004070 [Usnochroma carphineum]
MQRTRVPCLGLIAGIQEILSGSTLPTTLTPREVTWLDLKKFLAKAQWSSSIQQALYETGWAMEWDKDSFDQCVEDAYKAAKGQIDDLRDRERKLEV